MKVYQIWYETNVGATFSTKEKAEAWLDDEDKKYNEDWRCSGLDGYPYIREITVDDGNALLMDR